MRQHSEKKFFLLTCALLACTVLAIIISTGMGYMVISPVDILRVIGAALTGDASLIDNIEATIPYVIMDVRLPRILTAALVGAGLALSGVIYQGILLNPLADPYTLGISSGAAFGASAIGFLPQGYVQNDPATATLRAFGAHTANRQPPAPGCAPNWRGR